MPLPEGHAAAPLPTCPCGLLSRSASVLAAKVRDCPVGQYGKTEANDIFFSYNRQDRPAVVPPHAINGGSADQGGNFNKVGGGGRGASPDGASPASPDDDSDDADLDAWARKGRVEGDDEDGEEQEEECATETAPQKPANPGTTKYRPRKVLVLRPALPRALPSPPALVHPPRPCLPTLFPCPGQKDAFLNLISTLITESKAEEKKYEDREEKRAKAERDHQLAIIKLITGGGVAAGGATPES